MPTTAEIDAATSELKSMLVPSVARQLAIAALAAAEAVRNAEHEAWVEAMAALPWDDAADIPHPHLAGDNTEPPERDHPIDYGWTDLRNPGGALYPRQERTEVVDTSGAEGNAAIVDGVLDALATTGHRPGHEPTPTSVPGLCAAAPLPRPGWWECKRCNARWLTDQPPTRCLDQRGLPPPFAPRDPRA